jgi:antitoxin VapB
MALRIQHPEAGRLARELSALTGESLTEAVVNALRERLIRQRGKFRSPRVRDELRAIRERCPRYPVLDHRSPDEILGYDEHGLPSTPIRVDLA